MADDFDAFPTVDEPTAQTAAPPAQSDFSAFPAVETYRAAGYGPNAGDRPTHDTTYGPLGRLGEDDIAVSPNMVGQFPIGSRADIVDPTTGQVVYANQRVADYSYTSPGHPNYNEFEQRHVHDLGHMALRPSASGDWSQFPAVTQQAPKAAPAVTGNAVDPTGEAAAGTMAGEGPGTHGRPDITQSWDAFPTVESPETPEIKRPAETPTSVSDAQFLANPENVPRPQTPKGIPEKLPWEASKGILSEPIQQAWSNLFEQGSQAAAGLDVAAAKERLSQAEAGEQKPTSLFGGGPEAKEAEELRNPNISQADAQEIIQRRRERTDMDRQLAEADLSKAETEQAKAEAATPGPEYQRTIPGTVTRFLGRAAPWMLSSTMGAAAPAALANQMSEQAYGDAYAQSIEAGRKAHPDWNDQQLNAAAHRAGTEAAQTGFENGVVMGLLPVPKVGGLVQRLVSTMGLRGTYMTIVQASQDIENNIAVKKNVDPNQDIYDGVLAHAPQSFVAGAAFGIPEAVGGAMLERPAARTGGPQARPNVMPGMTEGQEPPEAPGGQRGAVVDENGEAAEEPEHDLERVTRPMTPAVRTPEGEIRTGPTHFQAAEDLPETANLEQGYVTPDGRFVSPEQAAAELPGKEPAPEPNAPPRTPLEETIQRERERTQEPSEEEAETFAGLGIPKKVRKAAFDIFSDLTRNVYERVKGAPHAEPLASAYKDYLNTRGEIEGKISVADHRFKQLMKEQPDLDERVHQIGKYVEDHKGALPAGMTPQETEVIGLINSGVAREIGDEARAIGLKVRVPTSVDPSGWRPFRGAPPGVPVFLRIMRPDVRATLQEPLTERDPASLGRPVQESDLTESAKKLYQEGQNTINKNTGKPYFQTPDDLLKWAADFKTRERQTATETSLEKGRLAPYPSFFYTYSPQATLGLLTRQAQEIARIKAFGQNTGQGDLFTDTVAKLNADKSLGDPTVEAAVKAVGDMQRDVYQLNKRGPLGRMIGGFTSIGMAAKLETSLKVLSSSLFTTGPYRGSLRTLAAIAKAAAGRGMPFDEFRRLGLASDIITNISDDPRAVTTAQQRASNFFRGSMKLAGHLASQDIARSITAAVSRSWLTKWAIPRLLKDPTGRDAATRRLWQDIKSRGMDPADFTKGPVDPKLIDRWVREDTLNLQTSYRPGSYPGWWSTQQGSFMVRFGHWSYDMSQRLVRDTLVPLARSVRAGDVGLAGLYAARLTSAVAAQVAGEELIRKIKELFGQQSGVATFGEIWKAFANGNPAGAHLLMTRLGSDLIGGPVFGMFSDLGQWIAGVTTGTADTTHAFNPASPASVAYMKIIWDVVNQMAQQGGKLSSKQIERATSSLSGMVRSWMDLAHTFGAPVPNVPALGVTGHNIEMGRRDVQFVRGRQNTFFTEHPQFDKRSKSGGFAGNPRTPYLQNINDALVSGDTQAARSEMAAMQKNLGLTPKEAKSTVNESVKREKPIPTGSGGIAFTKWGRVNMTAEELARMHRIDSIYRRTAAAIGVTMETQD